MYAEPFNGNAEQWDRFVVGESDWTSFHRHAWRPLLKSLYGLDCPFLCARDTRGSIAGVLPLVRIQSRTFGHFLISMPFVSYGGPLGSDAAALKDGLEVRFGPEVVDDFHAVYSRHMRDLGTPAQPLGFFHGLVKHLPHDAWFGVAYLQGLPIACGAGFRFRDEFEITWASSLREYNRISANMGLYWAFIERAANDGATRFNFGRCTPGSATHKFKQQWGAVDEPLWWYQSGGAGGTPSADSAKFRLATRIWQHLPVPFTRAMGGQIVRYLP